jgi:hypothetical protein
MMKPIKITKNKGEEGEQERNRGMNIIKACMEISQCTIIIC